MSYRHRRYRYRSRHHYQHPRPVSASDRAAEFVREEFFRLDRMTLWRLIQLYGREYGDGARQYLEKTYEKWRSGAVRPIRQTQDRILHCVPRVLSDEKQFQLLSFYIPDYADELRSAARRERVTLSGLVDAYRVAAHKCHEVQPDLDWFVSEVFSQEEIDAFTSVVRFGVLDRLHRSYSAVRFDLLTIVRAFASIDAQLNIEYHVNELGSRLALDAELPPLPPAAFDLPNIPPLVVRHRQAYERLLIEHDCEMIGDEQEQSARHAIAQIDLAVLQESLERLSETASIESDLHVQGAGGTLHGRLIRKDLTGLKLQLFGRVAVALLATAGMIGGIIAIRHSGLDGDWMPCSIFAGLILSGWIWGWVAEVYREVRDYERGRTARFAEVHR